METKVRRLCHDLKTERSDVGKPLPAVLRLLPIGAYFVAVAALGLCGLLGWQLRVARDERDAARAEEAGHKATQATLVAQADAIAKETKKAEEARKWTSGCESIQEIVVAIVRSMRPTSSLSDISLVRDTADPAKIQVSMQLSGGLQQLDETVNRVTTQLGYRPYSPLQKAEKGGEISYSATLIKQQKREGRSDAASASPPLTPAAAPAAPVAVSPAPATLGAPAPGTEPR